MTASGDPGDPSSLAERLFDRGVLFLRGALDDRAAGDLAMALMTRDASGDEPVALYVDGDGGTVDGALAVMDTIDLLGVPVHATCTGRVGGAAVGVVAVCDRRRASANARFRLEAPREAFEGAAGDVEAWLREHEERVGRFVARIAKATGRPAERLRAELDAGLGLDAGQARRYGLIDEVIPGPPRPVVVRSSHGT
jgi:ATP-dependent Clp protease protease subunit